MNLFEYNIQPLSFAVFRCDMISSNLFVVSQVSCFSIDASTNASSNDRPVIVVIVLAIMHVSVIE